MRPKVYIPAILITALLSSSLNGQWQEMQLDDGDMAVDLAEALTFTKYPTYPQYLEMLQYFAAEYPGICRLDTFGTSREGRLLLALKISDNVEEDEAEAAFLYTSSIHGDELVGYPMMLRLIDYLLTNYGEDPEVDLLVNTLEIWINPLANPDGTYHPDNDLSVALSVRENSDGSDLNREFPDPLAGEALNDTAGRAAETKAMMAFLQEHRFSMSANIHSGAEVVNYPWDHTDLLHADDGWFRFVSREYADEAKAVDPDYMSLFPDGITNGAQWYKIFGGRQDYVTGYLEGRELTLELCNEFRLESEYLEEYWLKNRRSLLNYLAQCMYGIRGTVRDAENDQPLAARVEIPEYDLELSPVHSQPAHGNFYRFLEEGTYQLAVSAPGYVSDTLSDIQVSNYRATDVEVFLVRDKGSDIPPEPVFPMELYPNPASDYCMIFPGMPEGSQVLLEVYTPGGIKILEKSLHVNAGGIKINTSGWAVGLYLVRCRSAQGCSVGRLMIH